MQHKNPRYELGQGGVSDVTHWKRGLRIFGIWEKLLIEFLRSNGKVEIQTWARPDDFVRYGRRAFVGLRADDVKAVSIERLRLSLLMSKTFKLKKGEKSFVPELISCFRIPTYVYEHYVYFTYPYHGYVTVSLTIFLQSKSIFGWNLRDSLCAYYFQFVLASVRFLIRVKCILLGSYERLGKKKTTTKKRVNNDW